MWEGDLVVVFCSSVSDWFVDRTERLPGVVQLAIWPVAFAVSILHLPFALTYLVISLIVDRIYPQELPVLSGKELLEWTREVHARWIRRHEGMCECNPKDVADGIALPIIDVLQEAIDRLDGHEFDRERVNEVADRLIKLPVGTAPDAHSIGLCIQHNLREWASGD